MEIFAGIKTNFEKDYLNNTRNDDIVKYIQEVESSHHTADKADKKEKIDSKELEESLKELNLQMKELNTDIEFSFDQDLDSLYIKVKEKSSGKIIRTIPSEELMRFYKKMKEFIGIIFDKKG